MPPFRWNRIREEKVIESVRTPVGAGATETARNPTIAQGNAVEDRNAEAEKRANLDVLRTVRDARIVAASSGHVPKRILLPGAERP